MNDRDKLREDRAIRVQTFGSDNTADFAAGSAATALFAAIDGKLAKLVLAKTGQSPDRASKATILDALWLDFKNIAASARTIGKTEPAGFAAPYTVPDDFTEKLITTHADKLLGLLEDNNDPVADGGDTPAQKNAKAALRAKFVALEMDPDFVTDLRADREALRDANKHNQSENQGGVENTEAIHQILLSISGDVDDLDTIMGNKYARQPEKLKAWHAASRVHRAPKREKKTDGGTTPAPKPTP